MRSMSPRCNDDRSSQRMAPKTTVICIDQLLQRSEMTRSCNLLVVASNRPMEFGIGRESCAKIAFDARPSTCARGTCRTKTDAESLRLDCKHY